MDRHWGNQLAEIGRVLVASIGDRYGQVICIATVCKMSENTWWVNIVWMHFLDFLIFLVSAETWEILTIWSRLKLDGTGTCSLPFLYAIHTIHMYFISEYL